MCDRGGAGWGLALDRFLRRTLAKPKRSASSSHFVLMIWLLLRRARGGGRVFRLPLPTPSGLPTHPQRPGDVPLDPKAEVALGVCLKKCHHSLALAHFFRAAAARRSDCVCAPFGRA